MASEVFSAREGKANPINSVRNNSLDMTPASLRAEIRRYEEAQNRSNAGSGRNVRRNPRLVRRGGSIWEG